MFKMGCSMARKILDGKGSSSSSSSAAAAAAAADINSSDNKGKSSKENQPSGATTKQEELNDFSKLEEDPRLPLNVRQIFKITKSWKAIARTMSKTGTAMFLNLFEQNQDLFYLFSRFQGLKGKDLHESMELREHAATVMSTLDQSINSLSDYDNFVNYLHSIGKLHRKVPGFKREHFWKIEQPFLKAVKQTLDERCNETIEEIYRIAIKLIIETISEGYGDAASDVAGPTREETNENGNGDADGGRGDKSSGGGQSEQGRGSDRSNIKTTTTTKRQAGQTSSIGCKGKAVKADGSQHDDEQQYATITAQSGENNQQQLYDKSPSSSSSLAATAMAQKTTMEASEQENPTIVGRQTKEQNENNCENKEELEDRLKTTIICLKELLSLAVKGVSEQQRRDLVGCETRLGVESSQKMNENVDEENKAQKSHQMNCGNGSVKRRKELQPNGWAALIGCSNANNSGNNNKNTRAKSPRRSALGLFGRLDRLFRIVNRTRMAALSRKGNLSSRRRLLQHHNSKRQPMDEKEMMAGEGIEQQFNDERQDTSREKGQVYLIETEPLPPSAGVVKRAADQTSCSSTKGSYNEHDNYSEILEGSDLCPLSSQLASSYSTNHELLLSRASRDATSHRVMGTNNHNTRKNHGGTAVREQQHQQPRSTRVEETSETTASDCRQLTTSLLRRCSIDDDDDDDRYSTRPCNETNSYQERGQQQNGLVLIPTRVALADMHSRDHNNGGNYLDEAPNEQNDDADATTKISNVRQPIGKHCEGEGGQKRMDDANGVCLSSFRSIKNKQSSSSPSSSLATRIVMLLLHAHKSTSNDGLSGSSSRSVATSSADNYSRSWPKVNENEDLVLVQVNGRGGNSSDCNHKPIGVHIGKSSHQSQIEMSDHEQKQQQQQQLGPITRQLGYLSPGCCPHQTPTTTTTATTAITTKKTVPPREQNKQTRLRTQTRSPLAAKSASRLTSNAGDLGELIKMFMLTLLTSSAIGSAGSNNNTAS